MLSTEWLKKFAEIVKNTQSKPLAKMSKVPHGAKGSLEIKVAKKYLKPKSNTTVAKSKKKLTRS